MAGLRKSNVVDDQSAQYSKISGGAGERTKYIYTLASDPQVFESQGDSPTN